LTIRAIELTPFERPCQGVEICLPGAKHRAVVVGVAVVAAVVAAEDSLVQVLEGPHQRLAATVVVAAVALFAFVVSPPTLFGFCKFSRPANDSTPTKIVK